MSEDAAVEALIKSFGGSDDQDDTSADLDEDDGDDPDGDDEGPAALDEIQASEEDGDEPEDQDDDNGDETPPAVAEAADDAVVRFTVDGETQEVTVASLKRLAGQEASLTRKSQEADLVGGRAAAALQAAIDATVEDLQPYADIDWMVLQQQMPAEEFQWHRENALRHDKRYRKLLEQAQNFEQTMQQRRADDIAARRQAAEKTLSDPTTGIAGWGEALRSEITAFAAAEGLSADDLANVTEPAVFRLLNKAMLYDRGQKAVAKKVSTTPAKVLKAAKRDGGAERSLNTQKAQQRLARSGSDDDAVAVLMGRWG